MENKATFIKALADFAGHAALYKCEPPMEYEDYDSDTNDYVTKTTEFVIVSAANVILSGPETYIFPADESGEVTDWGELSGSYRGGLEHKKALRGAGYSIAYT